LKKNLAQVEKKFCPSREKILPKIFPFHADSGAAEPAEVENLLNVSRKMGVQLWLMSASLTK